MDTPIELHPLVYWFLMFVLMSSVGANLYLVFLMVVMFLQLVVE